MGNQNKTLCKWDSKTREQKIKKYIKIVRDPEFICMKCGRAAKDKKHLCKSVHLNQSGN